jgi:hypothetical protein
METNKPYILENNDSIALLPVAYAYRFLSEEAEATQAMYDTKPFVSDTLQRGTPEKPTKRKIIEQLTPDTPEKTPEKKPKIEDSPSKTPEIKKAAISQNEEPVTPMKGRAALTSSAEEAQKLVVLSLKYIFSLF